MMARRPNIVLFLSDDLGYNDPSCYASDRHHTPHIDRLAGDTAVQDNLASLVHSTSHA